MEAEAAADSIPIVNDECRCPLPETNGIVFCERHNMHKGRGMVNLCKRDSRTRNKLDGVELKVAPVIASASKMRLNMDGEAKPKRNRLGDVISNALGYVGITEESVTAFIGAPCGCAERREKLNRVHELAEKTVSGAVSSAKEAWKNLLGRHVKEKTELKWSYGITTVPERRTTTLPRTLESLRNAGFDAPRLFVDGAGHGYDGFALEVTLRYPAVKTVGNFILGLWELYIREPSANRYVMFQDDIIVYRNLRAYLEKAGYPSDKAFCNLATLRSNQSLAPSDGKPGWFLSNQFGRSAMALMFSRDALWTLLSSQNLVQKPAAAVNPKRNLDGCIMQSFTAVSGGQWREYVHNPSLVQHIGEVSTMGNNDPSTGKCKYTQEYVPSFRGQDFDALQLLEEQKA